MAGPDNKRRSLTPDQLYLVLALFLIAAAASVMMVWNVPVHGGVDENGYLVAGRQIAETGRPVLIPDHYRSSPVPTFVGDMWVGQNLGTPQERYLTKYPPLVPLLIAAALKIGGQAHGVTFAYLLNPIGYCLGLLGVYLLARRLAGGGPALAALVVAIASEPVLRMFSIPGSHGISFAITSFAAYALVRWLQDGEWHHAVAAGILCSLAAGARAGEVGLVVPLAVAALVRLRRSRRDLLQSLAMVGSWAAIYGAMVLLQYAWSGHWSLYTATGESKAFGLHYLWQHLPIVGRNLLMQTVGLFLPLGVIGVVMLYRRDRALALALGAWIAVNVLLYGSYYWAPRNSLTIYSRFFLPSVGPLCACGIAALVWMAGASENRGRRAMMMGVLWIAALLSAGVSYSRVFTFFSLDTLGRMNIAARVEWLASRVPADAVIFADEVDALNHLQFASDYTLYDGRYFRHENLDWLTQFDPDQPNSLDAERRRYLNEVFVARTPAQLTQMRDELIAAYKKDGRRVFIFSGPQRAWASFDSLQQYGLRAQEIAVGKAKTPTLPTIPDRWSLEEVVAK